MFIATLYVVAKIWKNSTVFLKYIFIYLVFGCAGSLLLHTWAFSSCGERGLLFVAVCRLLIAVASLCCRARALGAQAAVVAAHGLGSCGLRVLECRLSGFGPWA